MALFENFPYTNLHELNLDWVIKEIEDLKEGQVLSVNGQTGDVILYQDNDILFPAVTDSHWSMVRSADGTTRGIMFGNDDKAYIVHGSTMEQIYSASNQPPYPVESVNGKTGAVSLFTDNNGVVAFPAITDPNVEGIIIGRSLNGQALYLKLNDDGTATITKGNTEEDIYTTADTDLNVFPMPEAGTTETGTNNNQWGVVREVNSGDIGLLFNLGETPEVYIRYRDAGLNWQNVKLLTNEDIPSSSGVVSFNGETGVVTVDGSDLIVSNTDTRTIAHAISDSAVTDYAIKGAVAYVENTNTATQNIPSGAYVIWQNDDYVSTQAISIGDTLSGTNLTALSAGGITNDLKDDVNTINTKINNKFAWTTFLSASNVSVGDTYASTGKSFTLTAPAVVQVGMSYGSGRPLAIGLKNSESAGSASVALTSVVASDITDTSGLTVTAILPAGTYYIWAKTASASGSTTLSVQGMPLGA